MKPFLSILIPSIPSRFERTISLYNKLLGMIGDMNIEILIFTDNKKRSIGGKREAIKNISKGKYFMFVDDDDDLLSVSEIYEAACSNDVDVITFKQRNKNKDGSEFIVTFGLGNPVEHNKKEDGNYLDCLRPPFHVCAWSERFKQYSFPDINYSEDWEFIKQCLEVASTEIHIDKVIHSYNFDSNITEASVESNEFWKNPNANNEN